MELIDSNHIFIIAEAGVNHNGSIALAKQLIDVATETSAGVDFVLTELLIQREIS